MRMTSIALEHRRVRWDGSRQKTTQTLKYRVITNSGYGSFPVAISHTNRLTQIQLHQYKPYTTYTQLTGGSDIRLTSAWLLVSQCRFYRIQTLNEVFPISVQMSLYLVQFRQHHIVGWLVKVSNYSTLHCQTRHLLHGGLVAWWVASRRHMVYTNRRIQRLWVTFFVFELISLDSASTKLFLAIASCRACVLAQHLETLLTYSDDYVIRCYTSR